MQDAHKNLTALIYDTETSGFPIWDKPSDDPIQPHVVQVAAKLIHIGSWRVLSSFSHIISAVDWEIPDGAAEVHGITTEFSRTHGIDESSAVAQLYDLAQSADFRVGHNESFDKRIIRIALKRFAAPEMVEEVSGAWKDMPSLCTMKLATPIVKLPPTEKMRRAGRNHHKSANLSEAYQFFTGQTLEDAHDAMVDVDATIRVLRGIVEHDSNVLNPFQTQEERDMEAATVDEAPQEAPASEELPGFMQ